MNPHHPDGDSTLLGRHTDYPKRYAPELLCPLPRADGRQVLGIGAALPFHGVDIWNHYELSWLDAHGKPQVRPPRSACRPNRPASSSPSR